MSNLGDQIKNLSPAKRALLEQKLAQKAAPGISRRQDGDPRVLSCAQEQLWFLDQLAPGSAAYNVPHAVRLGGRLDTEALQKALNGVAGRHEVLRTMYLSYQGRVIPAVAKQWTVELMQVDLRDAADPEEAVMPLLHEAGSRPFDLARDLKIRTVLYRLADERYIFQHVSHHIAWDLHSRAIFYRELAQYYRGFSAGEEPALPPLPLQYADYALWQRKQLEGGAQDRLQAYWKQQLTGDPAALNLPADFPRPAFQNLSGTRLPLQLDGSVLEDAKGLARDNRVTLYMVLLSAFYIFLHCYSGQEDISVGSPFDERRHAEMEPLIGMFINTLVLRACLDSGTSFAHLLPRVRDVVLGAIAHQDLPFEKIVDAVQPPRDLGRMPLFQANFRLQGGVSPALSLPGMDAEAFGLVDNATAKFDLALELPSVPESWGYLEYSTSLFKPETAQRMADDFQMLLRGLFAQPEAPIGSIEAVRTIKTRGRSR